MKKVISLVVLAATLPMILCSCDKGGSGSSSTEEVCYTCSTTTVYTYSGSSSTSYVYNICGEDAKNIYLRYGNDIQTDGATRSATCTPQ